jgi:hypothetical protein
MDIKNIIEIIENEIICLLNKYNIEIIPPILIRNRKNNYVFARYLLIKILQKYNFNIVNISEVTQLTYHHINYLLKNFKMVNNDEEFISKLLIELQHNIKSKLQSLIK